MAPDAVRGIERGRVRGVADQAPRLHPRVIRAGVEWALREVGVALRAGGPRVRRPAVGVHIMTEPAGSVVRVFRHIITRQPGLHLVTAEALRLLGNQRAPGRIGGRQPWKIGREAVTGDAADLWQLVHVREPDGLLLVTATLLAGARRRDELV